MELMELVENEPTTRPFLCDWKTCTKVWHSTSYFQERTIDVKLSELQPEIRSTKTLQNTHK
jgi:hypothetical protein